METASTPAISAMLATSSQCKNPTRAELMSSINLCKAHPYNSQGNKGNKFEEYPRFIVFYIEEHRMFISEWVYGTEDESCHQGAEE
jgi:hypothetical protein